MQPQNTDGGDKSTGESIPQAVVEQIKAMTPKTLGRTAKMAVRWSRWRTTTTPVDAEAIVDGARARTMRL